ncbi:MAG: SWIM zinc finger family protein [Planctomycetaceae bacterium]|nr:SWIM zinc finger family protein [Planctomycetaceae bacterium]
MLGILHRDVLRRLVDDRTFERGQTYAAQGRVTDLVRQERSLSAVVRGTTDYRVSIHAKGDQLAYSCTCPVGAEGAFCKHAVAVVLAWVAEVAPDALPAKGDVIEPPPRAEIEALARRSEALSREDAIKILLDEAATDGALCRRLARRFPGAGD